MSVTHKNIFSKLNLLIMKILIQTISFTLILIFNLLPIAHLHAQCHMDDWTALKAFYVSTNGDNWTNNDGWSQVTETAPLANCDLGIMYGVELGGNGRVSGLLVPNNQLSGTISPEIGNLTDLVSLDLYDNQLTGSIPSEIGNLTNLTRLWLSGNQLTGNIPPEIGNMTSLINVILSDNQLSGEIPVEITTLAAHSLNYLSLWSNQLSGSILPEFGNMTNLIQLGLGNNQLTGNIPPEIGNMTNLDGVDLSGNQLSGSIPTEIGNLTNLKYLNIADCGLNSSIPSEFGDLVNLEVAFLQNNQFTGSIPATIGNLVNLKTLYLFNNLFTGNIPETVGNLTNLEELRLSSNQFQGNILDIIVNYQDLEIFQASHNQFSGTIPQSINNLSQLREMSLYQNQFSGTLPSELGNLNQLTLITLGQNQFEGCYPNSISSFCSFQSFSDNFYISGGNNFDAPWEDFCNTGAGTCSDDVLPGDCNTDGIVNIEDVLYWGLAVNFTGVARPNATTDCSLQACPDWSQSVGDPATGNPVVNGKHQDCNGDGIVDNEDNQIIIDNIDIGCVSNYAAPAYASAVPIYRVEPQGINTNGEYEYDLYVENGTGTGANAHGLAFTISSDIIPISAIVVSATGSSLHPDAAFAITEGNLCYVALTRTNNLDVICDGPIATFLVETSDIPVGVPFEIDITFGSKIKADATHDNLTGASAFGMYNGFSPSSNNIFLDAAVTHEQCNGLGEALVIPSGGIPPYTYLWSNGANNDEVSNLASGTYIVTVTDSNGLNQSLTLQINGQPPIYDANGNLLCGNLCPEYLAPSGITGNGLYSASNALNSDAIIPVGNTAQYKAGQIIELKSGFKVQPDAEFSAEIEDCP